jgi:hypothetical protein
MISLSDIHSTMVTAYFKSTSPWYEPSTLSFAARGIVSPLRQQPLYSLEHLRREGRVRSISINSFPPWLARKLYVDNAGGGIFIKWPARDGCYRRRAERHFHRMMESVARCLSYRPARTAQSSHLSQLSGWFL